MLLPVYLILYFVLIVLNYFLAIAIEKSDKKKNTIYAFSIFANILILVFFKYFGFFDDIFSDISGISRARDTIRIILPVGLSFFIFSILSYLIEIKRETITAEKHIGIFASSLLFFPKIMQGPIERPQILIQFREPRNLDYSMIAEGVKLILWGFFKKLVVAERLALYVNAVYDNVDKHDGITLLVATIFYSFQIYADFSGYTDIALGSAKILGLNLTNNFKRPYFSTSVKEFWNRWHISFSTWLRDYLFLPLAIVFAGKMKRQSWLGITIDRWVFLLAVNITFIVCGIWHGEGLNFIIWGLLFGIFQTTANWSSNLNKKIRKGLHISKKSVNNRMFNMVITFLLVSFAWIFFRADSASEAFKVIEKIFSFNGSLFIDYQTITHGVFGIIMLMVIDYIGERNAAVSLPFKTNHWVKEVLVYTSLAVTIILTGVLDGGQFIYFQF